MKRVQIKMSERGVNENERGQIQFSREFVIKVAAKPALVRVACVEGDRDAYCHTKQVLMSSTQDLLVEHYATGAKALSSLPSVKPHVVLINSELPDIPGVVCTNRLKRLAPSLHVVMKSSSGNVHDLFLALAAGASGFLIAPVADADLIGAVREGQQGIPFLCRRAQATMVDGLHKCYSRLQLEGLSRREQEVMASLLGEGSDKAIGESLHIATSTARVHVKHLLKKLQVHNRTEAIRLFLGL